MARRAPHERPFSHDHFCLHCSKPLTGRRDKFYCNYLCAGRFKANSELGLNATRACAFCKTPFEIKTRRDVTKKFCNRACNRRAKTASIREWQKRNPDRLAAYRATERVASRPREKTRRTRLRDEYMTTLGGRCIVCGIDYLPWLELDYIPTTRGQPKRHPRHAKWMRENLHDFRVLCANHHRELTTTGHIRGTDITQGLDQEGRFIAYHQPHS